MFRLYGTFSKVKTRKYRFTCIARQIYQMVEARSITRRNNALINAFRTRIIDRYGFPKMLIPDNGKQFVNNAFKEILNRYAYAHKLIQLRLRSTNLH